MRSLSHMQIERLMSTGPRLVTSSNRTSFSWLEREFHAGLTRCGGLIRGFRLRNWRLGRVIGMVISWRHASWRRELQLKGEL